MSSISDHNLGSRFVRRELVAAGAFGEIHRGWDSQADKPVAIKRLHEHLCGTGAEDRFRREAQILMALKSEHVVRAHQFGRDEEGRPALILEWLEGTNLATFAENAPMTIGTAVALVADAALGLSALHANGVVHRDVKPSNFFVTDQRHTLLLDLGVAQIEEAVELTVDGEIIGTPHYMSPEQAEGRPDVGPASDVYSLGVLLYQLLAGRRPFTGTDPFAVIAKILLSEPAPLREVVPSLPASLSDAVEKAMQRDPSARFRSVLAFSEALKSMMGNPTRVGTAIGEVPTVHLVSSPKASSMNEQRLVVALFFRGSQREEDTGSLANTAQRRTLDICEGLIRQGGGIPHRARGDRMIAVFGAASATEGQAERAATVGLLLSARFPEARVAITSGRAISSAIGLSGEIIERGARALERAERGAIPLDGETAQHLGGAFLIKRDGDTPFLIGKSGDAGTTAPTLLGTPTPTVGRDDELSHLQARFRACRRTSRAGMLLVTGTAGIGKSRLRRQFIHWATHREPAPTVLFGRGRTSSTDPSTARLGFQSPTAFLPIVQAIRRSAGIADDEDIALARRKLRTRIGAVLPRAAAKRAVLFLGEMCGVPFPDGSSETLRAARRDLMVMGDGIKRAWEDWLEAETEARPVLLVLEDFHAADFASLRLVDGALRHLRNAPLFVLCFARPEVHDEFPGLAAMPNTEELSLGPLSDAACRGLAKSSLPHANAADIERLIERASGNPLYLEELIRAKREGEPGALPVTALGVMQSRINALNPTNRRVLRAASVLGKAFTCRGVHAIVSGAPSEAHTVTDALNALADMEILSRRNRPKRWEDDEYAFRSGLLRDAIYATYTDADRTAAHLRAAAWLESCGAEDPSELADHYVRAGAPRGAARLFAAAAELAMLGGDFARAADCAELVVNHTTEAELRGRALLLKSEAHRRLGALEVALTTARAAAEALRPGRPQWFRSCSEIAAAGVALSRAPDVEAAARAASEETPVDDDAPSAAPDERDTDDPDAPRDSWFAPDPEALPSVPLSAAQAKAVCISDMIAMLVSVDRDEYACQLMSENLVLLSEAADANSENRQALHRARAALAERALNEHEPPPASPREKHD